MATEFEQISKRIRARAELDDRDRARRRALIREWASAGRRWDEIQAASGVSRPTIADALRRPD